MQTGAIILCGGRSTRMGHDKATLPFGPESMLQRVVRLLAAVVPLRSMAIVAAEGQRLPVLPAEVVVVRDARPERGPLEGLAAGFPALPPGLEAVYATSCDVPLLVPDFVRQMFRELGDRQMAVPYDGTHYHPLAAVYRPGVLTTIHRLLASDCLRPRALFDELPTNAVPVDTLRPADPDLSTLWNLNTPDDYQAVLRSAGFTSHS